jgi:hypothetical protein
VIALELSIESKGGAKIVRNYLGRLIAEGDEITLPPLGGGWLYRIKVAGGE